MFFASLEPTFPAMLDVIDRLSIANTPKPLSATAKTVNQLVDAVNELLMEHPRVARRLKLAPVTPLSLNDALGEAEASDFDVLAQTIEEQLAPVLGDGEEAAVYHYQRAIEAAGACVYLLREARTKTSLGEEESVLETLRRLLADLPNPPAPCVAPYSIQHLGALEGYRITANDTDSRVATCYDEGHAILVTKALNAFARSRR